MTAVAAASGRGECGAARAGRRPCGLPAGWGTDHVGFGRCRLHGGCTPTHTIAAQQQMAEAVAAAFGLPQDVDPHEALLQELHRTAGRVVWLDAKVVGAGEALFFVDSAFGPVESPWSKMLARERKHLVAVAEACLRAGVEERRVRVVEQGAAFAAQAIKATLERLGHRMDDPQVEAAVRSSLQVVDGGIHGGDG